MGKSMFKQGYSAVREEKQRQDEAREKAGKNLYRFFLADDGDEADVRFLTEEPVTFNEHNVKVTRNGKETFDFPSSEISSSFPIRGIRNTNQHRIVIYREEFVSIDMIDSA